MPVPEHLSSASTRTHQRMMATCRPGSASPATAAASVACISPVSEHMHLVGSCSTSTPTGWLATAATMTSPECVSENAGPSPASTGLPDGRPHAGHGSLPNASLAGSSPV